MSIADFSKIKYVLKKLKNEDAARELLKLDGHAALAKEACKRLGDVGHLAFQMKVRDMLIETDIQADDDAVDNFYKECKKFAGWGKGSYRKSLMQKFPREFVLMSRVIIENDKKFDKQMKLLKEAYDTFIAENTPPEEAPKLLRKELSVEAFAEELEETKLDVAKKKKVEEASSSTHAPKAPTFPKMRAAPVPPSDKLNTNVKPKVSFPTFGNPPSYSHAQGALEEENEEKMIESKKKRGA